MFLMFLTFVVVMATLGALLWFGFQRVALHLRGDPDATRVVVEHVLIPLFGRKQERNHERWPDDIRKGYDAPSREQENET